MKEPEIVLINYLLSVDIDPDTPDYDNNTPINLLAKYQVKNQAVI